MNQTSLAGGFLLAVLTAAACGTTHRYGTDDALGEVKQPLAFSAGVKLVASDSALQNGFGDGLALANEWLLVGAIFKKRAAHSDGVVYAFENVGGTWVERQQIAPFEAKAGDTLFGGSLAAEADHLAIANSYREMDPQQIDVLALAQNGWEHETELHEPGTALGAVFGRSLSMSGGTLLVTTDGTPVASGHPGAGYVFVHEASGWNLQATLSLPDLTGQESFGFHGYLHGDDAFVGTAPTLDNMNQVLHYFSRAGDDWTYQQAVESDSMTLDDNFGKAIAVDGDELFVGTPKSDALADGAGAVYVFARSDGGWTQSQVLLPWNEPNEGNKRHNGEFGWSLAVDGDLLLVGALSESTAYVFERDAGGIWQPAAKLFNRQAPEGGFGGTVALRGRTAIIGAPQEGNPSEGTIQNGAVYVFNLLQSQGEPCKADADCATKSCVDGTCSEPSDDAGAGGVAGAAGTAGAGDMAGAGGSAAAAPHGPGPQPNGCACRVALGSAGREGPMTWGVLSIGFALGLRWRRRSTRRACSQSS